jgi:hypothetical protein
MDGNYMGDIIMDISIAQDVQMIIISCFQYDLSTNIQIIFFYKKQKPNFNIINNNSSNLYFITDMHYSEKTFFIKYLTTISSIPQLKR